jgi:ribosomal protein S18 acetylase RimI-like enzyme
MAAQLVIRPACPSDCNFIAGLVPSLLEFGSPARRESDELVAGFREVLARAIDAQDARATVLIAQAADGSPLGFISLTVRHDVAGVARGHVADIAVAEGARRIGVGSALMRAGEAWARERGLTAVTLDVWSSNETALAFYRRLGYSPESLCLIRRLD